MTVMTSASSLSFVYVECDIPPEMTIGEWRRSGPSRGRRSWRPFRRAGR
jgi:hypothetical protein